MDSANQLFWVYFLIGCFSLNSLYHYFLFFFYKKNYSALYFALINTTALLFNLMHLFHTPFDQKIGTLIFIANPLFFLLFVRSFFPEEFVLKIDKAYAALSGLLFLTVLAFPNALYLNVFARFNRIVMFLLVFYAVYVLQALLRALIHRRPDALAILTGMAVLLAFSFIRYLLRDSFVRIPNPLGALFLMFFYTLTLAKRFSDAYYSCSDVVEQRTRELNEANALLKSQAMKDALTGLYNRRAFFDQADHFLNHARRYENCFCVLMVDVDHFKKVNDRYGHQAGDSVLKGLAGMLEDSIRSADFSARYGGEEFILILDEIGLEEAIVIAEKIRTKVCGMEFLQEDDSRISVTVSIGIAAYQEGTLTIGELVGRADEALYHSKDRGRNCTTFRDEKGELVPV